MNESGQEIFISGFKPLEVEPYWLKSLEYIPEDLRYNVRLTELDTKEGEKEHAWLWVTGEAINGVHVGVFETTSDDQDQIAIFIPAFASGMDVYLAYGIMNAIKAIHPEAQFQDANGDSVDIDDTARDDAFWERLNIFAMLLELPEPFVKIPCINGEWTMDIQKYKDSTEAADTLDRVQDVLYDIIDFIWYNNERELTN